MQHSRPYLYRIYSSETHLESSKDSGGNSKMNYFHATCGVLIILHAIVIWPLTSHHYKSGTEHAGFSPDQARMLLAEVYSQNLDLLVSKISESVKKSLICLAVGGLDRYSRSSESSESTESSGQELPGGLDYCHHLSASMFVVLSIQRRWSFAIYLIVL